MLKEKAKDMIDDWKSPVMYTHVGGYKFCVGVDANGRGVGHGWFIGVSLWAMLGEFDGQLKWPAKTSFTIELINQQGGENVIDSTGPCRWHKHTVKYCNIGRINIFLNHSKLNSFLNNDTLYFHVSRITLS